MRHAVLAWRVFYSMFSLRRLAMPQMEHDVKARHSLFPRPVACLPWGRAQEIIERMRAKTMRTRTAIRPANAVSRSRIEKGMRDMKKQRHVLFCSDDAGFSQLKVATYSLLQAADPARPLRISVFTGGETKLSLVHRDEWTELAAAYPFASVEIVDVSPILAKYHDVLYNPSVPWCTLVWARCFIGEVFASETENIVYLDIDTFVCRDLGELYDLGLGTDALAAVYEHSRAEAAVRNPGYWNNAALLDPRAGYYFNSGVLVLNLDVFRSENILSRAVDWYAQHRDRSSCPDQDALNALLWNRVRPLPPKWNYRDGWCELQLKYSAQEREWRGHAPRSVLEAILSPAIIHYLGKWKPWKWNHRPERKRYERAMRELGMVKKGQFLPGTTPARRLEAWIFDGYHALLRRLAAFRLKRLG